jgi:hypothetical protein
MADCMRPTSARHEVRVSLLMIDRNILALPGYRWLGQ